VTGSRHQVSYTVVQNRLPALNIVECIPQCRLPLQSRSQRRNGTKSFNRENLYDGKAGVARGFLSGSSALNVQIVVFKEHNGVCVSNPFP